MRTLVGIAFAMSVLLGATPPTGAEETQFTCPIAPDPVVSLDYGSRYEAGSKTRSEIDEVSNAEIDKALRPLEKFISDTVRMANDAIVSHDPRRANCVLDWLDQWAEAKALARLDSMNVQLSMPARFAGIAIAVLEAETVGPLNPVKRQRVIGWLSDSAAAMTAFFESGAPTNASRNNLRAWAGLAATAIGRLNGDAGLIDWGRQSFELVVCQAADDGSLPLEMHRADRALNYQLHATAPLVVTAQLLRATGYDGYEACGGKLQKVTAFSLAAVRNPSIVEAITKQPQVFSSGDEPESFMLAWLEPYLRERPDGAVEAFAATLRPLAHAKLGGNLTKIGDWVARLPRPIS